MNPHSLGLTSSLLSGLDQRLLQQQQQQLLQNHFRLGTQALDPALIARAQLVRHSLLTSTALYPYL